MTEWFNTGIHIAELDKIDPGLTALLTGDDVTPSPRPVQITIPPKNPGDSKINFVLYKVQFEPFKFNYWNTRWKRLYRRVFGTKRAMKHFYKDALTISYTGKALANEPNEIQGTVGRLRPSFDRTEGRSQSAE